jgi:hypothetical protein
MGLEHQIVNVNEYELVDTPEAFTAAISALARRTEAEGHPGVLAYRFYVSADAQLASATIVYEDADAWLGHHRIAYTWPEMPALQATVRLQRLTFLGPFNDALAEWVSDAGITVPLVHIDTFAAGFVRDRAS